MSSDHFRVSPRKLRRSDIPNEAFHALREMVSNELSSIPSANFASTVAGSLGANGQVPDNANESNKISFGFFEDEDSRMSGCESSEGSQSQFSVDEDATRSSAKGRPAGCSSSASSLSQVNPLSKCMKQSTRCRRLTELRAARRKASETDENHHFSCSEEDLPATFGQWYDNLMSSGEPAVKCYHLVVNSLTKFFIANTFGNTIKTMVVDFLRNHVIRTCSELNKIYDGATTDGERRLRETQLQVLLELYASYLDPSGPSKMPEIVRKMRIIYFVASATKMRTFLEEQVADNFVHLVPKLIAEMFDELCIQLPDDLEEYDSVWNKDEDLSFPLFLQKTNSINQTQQLDQTANRLQQLDLLIEEVQTPEEDGSKSKVKDKVHKTKSESEKMQKTEKAAEVTSKKEPQRKSERLHVPRIVPETPEEKLRPVVKEGETEIVKATPAVKMCRNLRHRKSKLSELVRISEERARIPRAAALASAKASKAIIQASFSGTVTRESLLGLHTSSSRISRARSNLLKKFTSVANRNSNIPKTEDDAEKPTRVLRSASLSANMPVKRSTRSTSAACEPPEKKSRSIPSPPSMPKPHISVGIDDILGPEQIARFQQRVEEINKLTNEDDDQVYHAELVRRSSLFDEEVLTSTPGKNMQQNRTRRVITAGSSAAHLAHTLLNVDNVTPLEEWKLPKNWSSPEKMPRMIRTGFSAVKLKKIQRMREQCSVSSSRDSRKLESSV